MSNFTRLLLFAAAWLMLLLAACAAPAPTATATLTFTPEPTLTFTPAPTATITPAAGAVVGVDENGQVTIDGIPRPTATPEPSPTPEPLLPPDFTVKNLKEFRTAILPYCYVNPDYSDSREGVENFYNDIKDSDFWKDLGAKFNKGEKGGRSPGVVSAGEDGGCGIITIDDLFNNQILASVFFQSKLDPNQWIEVKFTEPSR